MKYEYDSFITRNLPIFPASTLVQFSQEERRCSKFWFHLQIAVFKTIPLTDYVFFIILICHLIYIEKSRVLCSLFLYGWVSH